MTFIWPWVLLSLAALPVCVFLYVLLNRRRNEAAARLGALGGIVGSFGGMAGKRRHIPPMIFLIAAAILAIASARPQVTLPMPRLEGTIVLAMDVSSSMAADDVEPTRMEAAKMAARALVEQRPGDAVIGVVAFGEGGLVVQPPTSDVDELEATINRLTPESGTSLGRGIVTALEFISAETDSGNAEPDPDSIAPALIVLISDGENTAEADPFDAAQLAIERGVRIHTVGVGTVDGAIIEVDGFNLFTQMNEPVLQEIALQTEGTYFRLEDLEALPAIYEEMEKEFVVEQEEVEVTSVFGGVSALLLLLGGVFSLSWFGRMP